MTRRYGGDRPQFSVERRGRGDSAYPGAGYASQAGDARRQGRADPGARGVAACRVEFVESAGKIEARLGVVTVGWITTDMGGGYLWLVLLPDCTREPKPAGTIEKARDAVEHRVRQWCEAARLISARRG